MNLQFDEFGNGSPVILVHGLGGTGNLWGGMVPTLARQFRVICPDMRGSGRTPRFGNISTETLVVDLIRLVDQLGIVRAHWIGHSYGSVVVQKLAVDNPSRVLSLSLIGPIQGPTEVARTALQGRSAKARTDGLAEIATATAQVGTSAETKVNRPEVAAFVREMVMRQDSESYALTCEAVANCMPAKIEQLRCPTLVITGDQDMTSPPLVAGAIADKIDGARFHVLPRCGHWAPIECAFDVTNLVMSFLLNVSKNGALQQHSS